MDAVALQRAALVGLSLGARVAIETALLASSRPTSGVITGSDAVALVGATALSHALPRHKESLASIRAQRERDRQRISCRRSALGWRRRRDSSPTALPSPARSRCH